MSKEILNRYIWLVDTIYQAGSTGITFNKLANKWKENIPLSGGNEYSWRTFMRHKADVMELFGVEIRCHKSTNTYYLMDRNDITDSSRFRRWLIETMSVNNRVNECAQLKERILLEQNPSGEECLPTILEAMRDNLMLTFSYKAFWYETERVSNFYHVEPYALKVFKRRWYLLAKYGNNPLKIYALDRIQDIDIEFGHFELPENFSAADYFSTCFGIMVGDKKPQIIKLKIDAWQANYIRTLPLHTSQKEIKTTKDYSVFSYYLRPTFDLTQEIISMKESVEVLEPKSLRAEIASIGKALAHNNCPTKKK